MSYNDDKPIDFNLKVKPHDMAEAVLHDLTFHGETYHDNHTVELLKLTDEFIVDILDGFYHLAKSVSSPAETRYSAREISIELDKIIDHIIEGADDVRTELKRREEK